MPDLKEKNRIILKNSKMHELWDLGAPTILEQALQTIVAYVDTAMVGQIGAIASAAVGIAFYTVCGYSAALTLTSPL